MGDVTNIFVGIDVAKVRNAVAIADGERGGEVRLLRQKRQASAGVDGITMADYEQNLERTSGTSAAGSTRCATGHNRSGASTSQKPMAGGGPSVCRPWRTR